MFYYQINITIHTSTADDMSIMNWSSVQKFLATVLIIRKLFLMQKHKMALASEILIFLKFS